MEYQNVSIATYKVHRQHLCTHVTSLKALDNFLFVAESNQILLYDWKNRILLQKEIVFQSCSIHGIRIDDSNNVAFFGAKSFRIYAFTSSSVIRLISITEELCLDDWIHDIQWLKKNQKNHNCFAAISAHNCLTIWDLNEGQTGVFQSAENCILYAGSIISKNEDVLVVAAGTVFKEIILWSPYSILEKNGRKLPFQHLTGHQGVIFSISYNKFHKLLSSTSDDRSVRLWKVNSPPELSDDSLEFWEKANIEIVHVLFAHESRVWMSAILENCILSVGEDSHLCFWNLNGKLLTKKKCHKSGSIWCLETTSVKFKNDKSKNGEVNKYVAFTGGSDGGVYMWDVANAFAGGAISQISLHFREASSNSDFPRIICLLTEKMAGHVMVTTDKGWLSLYNMKLKNWKDIFCDSTFASYCVPSLSNKSVYLALGNICGEIVLLNLNEQQSEKSEIKKLKIHESNICSVHWVNETSDYLLTCGIKGHMTFWKVKYENKEFSLECIQELFLPKCKHHWWSTAALYLGIHDCIIVGDRSGSISLYSKLQTDTSPQDDRNKVSPHMSHRYIHGDNGVTDIREHKSLIYSAGRDGKIQLYSMFDNNLNLLHTIKVSHDLEWIGRMLFFGEDLLLLGFHTKDFIVWSTQLESAIMTVECGGGHRSWDFSLTDDGTATFAAIKKKDVIFCQENLQQVLKSVLKSGISGQEFCNAAYLFTKNYSSTDSMSVVACGGEDNALRIIGFINKMELEPQILPLCNLSGHLSSIRAINKCKLPEENSYLLVSVGGRSQMMIWKLKDGTYVECQQLASYILSGLRRMTKQQWKESKNIQMDPQTRLMDVALCRSDKHDLSSGMYMISTACSDSYFRIYMFNIHLRELALLHDLHHGEHCILKLSKILVSNCSGENTFFITGATDGYINMFNHKSYKCNNSSEKENDILPQLIVPDLRLKTHLSGINALDTKSVNDTYWLIGTAGDDNALSISLIALVILSSGDKRFEVISKAQVNTAHASQITGIKILDENVIVTASIDQRINIWKWEFTNNHLVVSLCISKMSLIPDIAHMEAWQDEITKYWTLLVCGQGIECFTLTINDSPDENVCE